MNSVIVLQSAKRRLEFYNNDIRWCCYAQCAIAMWPTMIIHGNYYNNQNDKTQAALEEALNHLGLKGFYVGTLSRGGVHHTECDPPNGLVEYTGGMAYVIWSWETIIKWLTYGWPRPNIQNLEAPIGTWMWNDFGEYKSDHIQQQNYDNLIPAFGKNEALQLKQAGVPRDVMEGKRLLTENEAIDIAARALANQRAYRKKNKAYYRQHQNKTKHHETDEQQVSAPLPL